jgi:hypothetical protein
VSVGLGINQGWLKEESHAARWGLLRGYSGKATKWVDFVKAGSTQRKREEPCPKQENTQNGILSQVAVIFSLTTPKSVGLGGRCGLGGDAESLDEGSERHVGRLARLSFSGNRFFLELPVRNELKKELPVQRRRQPKGCNSGERG